MHDGLLEPLRRLVPLLEKLVVAADSALSPRNMCPSICMRSWCPPVDLQRSRDFQVWPPLEKSLSISFRDGEADAVAVVVMAEAAVVATDGSDVGGPQSDARIHVVGRRQEFSPPLLNATRHNSPTLQLPPLKHARCCAAALAVCDTPPCAHFRPWSQSGAVLCTRRPPPLACFQGGIG